MLINSSFGDIPTEHYVSSLRYTECLGEPPVSEWFTIPTFYCETKRIMDMPSLYVRVSDSSIVFSEIVIMLIGFLCVVVVVREWFPLPRRNILVYWLCMLEISKRLTFCTSFKCRYRWFSKPNKKRLSNLKLVETLAPHHRHIKDPDPHLPLWHWKCSGCDWSVSYSDQSVGVLLGLCSVISWGAGCS